MKQGISVYPSTDTNSGRIHPPKPGLVFRVGVVGHRPNRLQHADLPLLAGIIKEILSAIKNQVECFRKEYPFLFSGRLPQLRAISPLAEGSDRIFAQQALDLDAALCCPMPFYQAEYEKDFSPDQAQEVNSLNQFRALLSRARNKNMLTTFELDGDRSHPGRAYGDCGRIVLSQSDLLVVIWDGHREEKPGGTEEILFEAQHRGLPIVWISALAPHNWIILDTQRSIDETVAVLAEPNRGGGDSTVELMELVRSALAVPQPDEESNAIIRADQRITETLPLTALTDFYREKKKKVNRGIWWKFFRDLLGNGRWPDIRLGVENYEKAVEKDWRLPEHNSLSESVHFLHPFYAWSDKLAVHYSNIYRSTFIRTFLLSAIAVALALLPVALGKQSSMIRHGDAIYIILELLAILWILISVLLGHRKRWHERWIDYRLIAELIRHLRLMVPLGSGRPFPKLPTHLASYGNPANTWMAWYVRAIERDLGLPTAQMNDEHLKNCREHLSKLLQSQIDFHESNTLRCQNIERRLQKGGIWVLGLTLLACAIHLFPDLISGVREPHQLPRWLVFLCGFLPALGAAFAGIMNQGEFRRLGKRSAAMHMALVTLQKELSPTSPLTVPGQAVTHLTLISRRISELMTDEVMDWRIVFKDRPLELIK